MTSKIKQQDILQQVFTTAGTADAYTLTIHKLDTLTDEQVFFVQFHLENNASATLNINSLGAIAIMTSEGNAVDAGDLKTTGRYTLVYDADTASFVVSGMVDSDVEFITWVTWNTTIDTVTWLTVSNGTTTWKLFSSSWFLYWNYYSNSLSSQDVGTIQFSIDNSSRTTVYNVWEVTAIWSGKYYGICIYVPGGMYVKVSAWTYATMTIDKFISL